MKLVFMKWQTLECSVYYGVCHWHWYSSFSYCKLEGFELWSFGYWSHQSDFVPPCSNGLWYCVLFLWNWDKDCIQCMENLSSPLWCLWLRGRPRGITDDHLWEMLYLCTCHHTELMMQERLCLHQEADKLSIFHHHKMFYCNTLNEQHYIWLLRERCLAAV